MTKGSLSVISGFSGAGKGTVVRELMKLGGNYSLSVSMTTRQPRNGEVEGKDYFFVSTEQFEEKITNGGLLEYAAFVDHYYGTPKEFVKKQIEEGKDVILEIESQGGAQIKRIFSEAILVFITAPNAEELSKRLMSRGTETPEAVYGRLRKAEQESHIINNYDYIIVNENHKQAECAAEINTIIQSAKHAPYRNKPLIEGLQKGFDELIKEYVRTSGGKSENKS